jgi:MarR family transcriptional regulator, transcriptional regulator for hemolysin
VNNQPDILFVLHDLARQLRLDADRRARNHGMTRAQWIILFWLERQPGLSQKELAELLEVEPITVGRLVDRLELRGMVERRPDPRDRRIWRLHLCPPSAPVLAELHEERAVIHRMATAGLDEAALAALQQGLCRMKANVVAELRARAEAETLPLSETAERGAA